MYKNIILYSYSSLVTLMWHPRAVGESSHTQRSCLESEQPAGTDFSQYFKPYIVLTLLRDQLGHASSPTQCLFFIGHGLHSRHACFSLVLFTNPSARAGYDTRSVFKRSLTGLNSEFSFS